jgi:hypothetical protein
MKQSQPNRPGWKRALTSITFCLVAAAPLCRAQTAAPVFPAALDKKLAARASNVDEVTMDKNMLGFAGQFMKDGAQSDAEAKNILRNLDGIYVRSYEFDKPGAYTQRDLDEIRRQFLNSEWSPMVRERSLKTGESTDVYTRVVNGKIRGMLVLDAEPKELQFVYLTGDLKPSDLNHLSGNFGVPNVHDAPSTGQKHAGGAQ